MEQFSWGVPKTWAFIDGEPYVLTEYEYASEVETTPTASGGSTNIRSIGQSINGSGKLFGKKMPNVFKDNDVPRPTRLEIADRNQHIAFGGTMFSSMQKIPGYEKCVAFSIEWIAEDMSHERRPENLSHSWP